VSVVTEVELLIRPLRSGDEEQIERVGALLGGPGMSVVEMDREIARLSSRIRALDRLDLPDAVIVATAIYAGCDVIVGNDARCAQRVRDIPYVFLDDLVKEHTP
jgi:predicted nucleic acid-binding protein